MNQFFKSFIFRTFWTIFVFVIVFFSVASIDPICASENTKSTVGIKSYKFDAVVSKDHVYNISQSIVIDVHDQLKDYTLYIPKGNYKVKDINVKGANFYIESTNYDYKVILKPLDKLEKGQHKLKLSYKIYEYSDKDKSGDLFYMNVLPSAFNTPIENIEINILFPNDFVKDDLQYFAGQFGVQDVSNKVSANINNNELNMAGKNIPENFSIIIKANLPENYWIGELDNSWMSKVIVGLSIIMILVLIFLWFIGGRDPKVDKGNELPPNFSIPPPEANYLLNGNIGIHDVISMIIYLGSKGYLNIIENEPKKYRLINVTNPEREPRYIRSFFSGLFGDEYLNNTLEMNDFIKKLSQLGKNLSENVKSVYAGSDMLSVTGRSKTFRLLGILLIALLNSVIVAINCLARYISIDFINVITIFILTAGAILLINLGLDNIYRPNKLLNIALFIAGSIVFLLIMTFISFNIYNSFNDIMIVILYAVLIFADIFFIYIMKARASGNAMIVADVVKLRNSIIHMDNEEIIEKMKDNQDYFYEILPYAYSFLLLDRWTAKFKDIDFEDVNWLRTYENPQSIDIKTSNNIAVDFSNGIEKFGRTVQSEYLLHTYRRKNSK